MKNLPKIRQNRNIKSTFKHSASKKLAKTGGTSEPPLVTGLGSSEPFGYKHAKIRAHNKHGQCGKAINSKRAYRLQAMQYALPGIVRNPSL